MEEVSEEPRFLDLHTWAAQQQEHQLQIVNTAAAEMATAEEQKRQLLPRMQELDRELRSLRSRPDLIPEDQRELRARIAEGAGVSIGDLPFAGELMDVREEHQLEWRGALERLLRGFGLSILVPDGIYSRVNRFINDHNMRGRAVYHRVPVQFAQESRGYDRGRVIERMTFKEGHPLAPWVEAELRNQFNHRCCDTPEEFEQSTGFAVTKQGLIRAARTRHVKDDLHDIRDPRHHILGWSNRDKIRRFEQALAEMVVNLQSQELAYSTALDQQRKAQRVSILASNLAGFRSFADIDWRASAARKQELQSRKEQLERSSDQVRKLQDQLESVSSDIRTCESDRTGSVETKGALQNERQLYGKRLAQCEGQLQDCTESDLSIFDARFDQLLSGEVLTISDAPVVQQRASARLSEQARLVQSKCENGIKAATRSMEQFLNQFPEMRTDLASETEYLPEFLRLRQAVETDDLPRHEERFKELMSRDVLAHVASFQDTLETHCEVTRSKVARLNETLRGISYSPSTYIAIRAALTTDPDVRDFRSRLKSCLEFGLSDEAAARENAFFRIDELIRRLREKPEWTAKVTDTRAWLTFAIEKLRRDDNRQENYYNDSGGKSGGQKAKLAFTILASAIAYQYRIAGDTNNVNSFRFVVVDEMFARTDEENSRYALDLFSTFQLQLLIVSPFDARARVVEPHVSSYHLTVNPTTQSSAIRSITAQEAHERLLQQPETPPAHVNA